MNEFRFEHLRNRKRQRVPRPILYVGVAIILLAFFSIKWFQRAGEVDTTQSDSSPVAAPVIAPELAEAVVPAPPAEAASRPVVDPADDGTEGILSLDGAGQRIQPPRRISGEWPVIPVSLLSGRSLADPRVYVRVGEDGLVTDCKLVSSSGSDEVDRLVLDALGQYTFHPALTIGRPVAFSSVVTVPLQAADDAAALSGSGEGLSTGPE